MKIMLKFELVIIIIVKAIFLFLIWDLFFSDHREVDIQDILRKKVNKVNKVDKVGNK